VVLPASLTVVPTPSRHTRPPTLTAQQVTAYARRTRGLWIVCRRAGPEPTCRAPTFVSP